MLTTTHLSNAGTYCSRQVNFSREPVILYNFFFLLNFNIIANKSNTSCHALDFGQIGGLMKKQHNSIANALVLCLNIRGLG